VVSPVLLDASVLFPSTLRDTLLTLAEHDLFEPQWSTEILAEVRRSVIAQRSVPASAIDRTLSLMSATFEYATVDGWEHLVDQVHLPDPDDRHVLAAAITGGARMIVTANLRHFPAADLRRHRVRAASPDQFLQKLFDTEPDMVLAAFRSQAARYRRPPMDLDGLLVRLGRGGAPEFTKRVADGSS
jgi:predicted nucleic acid-binding protein